MSVWRKLLLILTVSLALFSFGIVAAQDEPITLRVAWWGGDQRAAMYNQLADLYEELHPNITIEREFAGWAPYWERLATETAGGNAPDVIHMHHSYVNEYAGRGALLDLSTLVGSGELDLSQFPEGIVQSGAVNDTVYMISLGNSASGTHYNTRLFSEAEVEIPPMEWTWNDFAAIALELQAALPDDVYASTDSGGWDATLEAYVIQRGYQLFAEDGTLAFPQEVLVDYWNIWNQLREAGAVPPIDVTVERSQAGVENNMLVTGEAAMMMLSGNQHRLFQQNTEDELGLTTLPRGSEEGSTSGDVVTGAYISISATTQHPEEAAAFINWMINDPDVARIYNGEHGPPGSLAMQEAIFEQQSVADHRLTEMMEYISSAAGPPGFRPPRAGEVLSTFTRIYQELAFGQHGSTEEAVEAFFDEADFILS